MTRLSLQLLLFLSAPAIAQQRAPLCTPADVSFSFEFLNQPVQELVTNVRNTSSHLCHLNQGLLAIAPGETANTTVTWDPCAPAQKPSHEISTLDGYRISSPSLLSPCSLGHLHTWSPGLLAETGTDDASVGLPIAVSLRPSAQTTYGYDYFSLYADIDDPQSLLPLKANSCPVILVETVEYLGGVSLNEYNWACSARPAATHPTGPNRGRSIHAELSLRGLCCLGQPEGRVSLLVLTTPPDAPHVRMLRSNEETIRAGDLTRVAWSWGTETNGIAMGLFLDKYTLTPDDDAALHIALVRLSADREINLDQPLGCFGDTSLELKGPDGKEIPFPETYICADSGWRSGKKSAQGEVVPVYGLKLSMRHLPASGPGDYTITAAWRLRTGTGDVVVRSNPVVFHVTAAQ